MHIIIQMTGRIDIICTIITFTYCHIHLTHSEFLLAQNLFKKVGVIKPNKKSPKEVQKDWTWEASTIEIV